MAEPRGERPDDTIDVRLDERFDETSLARYLRDTLEGAEGPLAVRQFGGGAANLTYLLQFNARPPPARSCSAKTRK